MALTDEQRRLYSTSGGTIQSAETVTLEHPGFTAPHHLTNWPEPHQGEHDGQVVTFTPTAYEIRREQRANNGRQDVALALSYVGNDTLTEVQRALEWIRTNLDALPITATFSAFILPDTTPTIDPVTLQLDNLSAANGSITGTAGQLDIHNRLFPRSKIRPDLYPGLVR